MARRMERSLLQRRKWKEDCKGKSTREEDNSEGKTCKDIVPKREEHGEEISCKTETCQEDICAEEEKEVGCKRYNDVSLRSILCVSTGINLFLSTLKFI